MSAHTPGPWKFVPPVDKWDDGSMGGFYGPDDVPVCDFGDGTQYYPTQGAPPSEEDAALICAAPELLAALREIERHHVEQNAKVHRPEARSHTLAVARAAIAKAEGR